MSQPRSTVTAVRRSARSLAAEAAFRARIADLGGVLLDLEWRDNKAKYHVRCAAGHDCYPRPNDVQQGVGICRGCSGTDPVTAQAKFLARLADLGATPLYSEWLGAHKPHLVRCANGHECSPRPTGVQGKGICRVCARRDPATAAAAFRNALDGLGATLLEPQWLGALSKHHVRCRAGHDRRVTPAGVQQGYWLCRECIGVSPKVASGNSASAESKFLARIAELGGVPLYETWLGSHAPHHVQCAQGHQAWPRPDSVRSSGWICRTCSGNDPAAAEATFRARLAELGATLLEPQWLGSNKSHRVRCSAGHECRPRPYPVSKCGGICRTCAGQDPRVAEARFREILAGQGALLLEPYVNSATRLAVRCAMGHEIQARPINLAQGYRLCPECPAREPRRKANSVSAEAAFRRRLADLGATLLEPAWLGSDRRHRARCAYGHECRPLPASVGQGAGICAACGGNDPAAAYAAFRLRIAELGAELLEPAWRGKDRKHHVRCAAGHDCWPQPGNVRQGAGICRLCAHRAWDAFYVVTHDSRPWVKFGITSGDGQRRLAIHRKNGYASVVRLVSGLTGSAAPDAEDAVKKALRDAGELPVQGREYFDVSCLALILDVADSWLAAPSGSVAGAA